MVLVVKNLSANAGDIRNAGSIPGSGRSPGGGHGNPLQYSCLGNPMDGGAWQAAVRGVTESWTRLKRLGTAQQSLKDCSLQPERHRRAHPQGSAF